MLLIKKKQNGSSFSTSSGAGSAIAGSGHSRGLMQNLQTLHVCVVYLCAFTSFKSALQNSSNLYVDTEHCRLITLLLCSGLLQDTSMPDLPCVHKKALSSAYTRQMDLHFADNRTYNYKCSATDVIHIGTNQVEDVQVDYLTNTDGNTWLSRIIVPLGAINKCRKFKKLNVHQNYLLLGNSLLIQKCHQHCQLPIIQVKSHSKCM